MSSRLHVITTARARSRRAWRHVAVRVAWATMPVSPASPAASTATGERSTTMMSAVVAPSASSVSTAPRPIVPKPTTIVCWLMRVLQRASARAWRNRSVSSETGVPSASR
jgi:hypothetical protein